MMLAPMFAVRAQSAPGVAPMPGVGDPAPDFTLPGATAAGPAGPLRLSDFRGKTVVHAFFFQARTKG
jgi:peroxiredoxin